MSIEFAPDAADESADAPVGAEPEAAEESPEPQRRESNFTDEDRAEIKEMYSFFTENDIPIPPDIQAEYDSMKEPVAAPEPPPEPEVDKNRQGWERRRAGLKADHERLRGEHSIVSSENQTLRQYNEALVQTVLDLNRRISGKGGAISPDAPAGQPVEQPEPEDAPDIIDAPDRFVDLRVKKEVEPLKQIVGQLVQLLHQERQQQQQEKIVSAIAQDRDRYEKVAPGFAERAQAWQAAYVEDLQAVGKTQEQANVAFYQMLSAITRDAMQQNRSPVEAVDIFARRVAAGKIAPTAPTASAANVAGPRRASATPVSDAIAAAREAGRNGVAREPSLPNSADTSEITFDKIRSAGVRPGDIKKILSKPGGEEEFWKLAESLERDGY
jgi:hypothetical protein